MLCAHAGTQISDFSDFTQVEGADVGIEVVDVDVRLSDRNGGCANARRGVRIVGGHTPSRGSPVYEHQTVGTVIQRRGREGDETSGRKDSSHRDHPPGPVNRHASGASLIMFRSIGCGLGLRKQA